MRDLIIPALVGAIIGWFLIVPGQSCGQEVPAPAPSLSPSTSAFIFGARGVEAMRLMPDGRLFVDGREVALDEKQVEAIKDFAREYDKEMTRRLREYNRERPIHRLPPYSLPRLPRTVI